MYVLPFQDGRKPGQQILVQEVLAQIRDIHTSTYSYEVLKGRPLPEGINVLCLESYLDDAEFEVHFSLDSVKVTLTQYRIYLTFSHFRKFLDSTEKSFMHCRLGSKLLLRSKQSFSRKGIHKP